MEHRHSQSGNSPTKKVIYDRHKTSHADARVRVTYGRQTGNGTGFFASSSVFSCRYNSTVALYSFNWGMNNRPAGGRS
jgi:hypothetical protein